MHDQDPLDYDCLHCALSAFLNEWRAKHGDQPPIDMVRLLLETVADVIAVQHDPKVCTDLRTFAMVKIVTDMADIRNGTYKPEEVLHDALDQGGRIQ